MSTKRRVAAVTAVAMLVVAGALVADWWETNREVDALVDQVESSQAAIRAANEELSDKVNSIDRVQPTAADGEAYAQAQARAMSASGYLAASRSDAQGLFVLPWHRSVNQARDAYVDYTRSWSAYFDDAATRSLDEWAADYKQLVLDIVNNWKILQAQLPDAVPPLSIHDADDRVDALLDSGR